MKCSVLEYEWGWQFTLSSGSDYSCLKGIGEFLSCKGVNRVSCKRKSNYFTIKWYLSVLGWSVMLHIRQKPNMYSFSVSSIPELLIYNFLCRSCHSCFLQHIFLPISHVRLYIFQYFVTCFFAPYHVRLGSKTDYSTLLTVHACLQQVTAIYLETISTLLQSQRF